MAVKRWTRVPIAVQVCGSMCCARALACSWDFGGGRAVAADDMALNDGNIDAAIPWLRACEDDGRRCWKAEISQEIEGKSVMILVLISYLQSKLTLLMIRSS